MASRRYPQTRVWLKKPTRELIRSHKGEKETYDDVLRRLALSVDIPGDDVAQLHWQFRREFERDTFADKNRLSEPQTRQTVLSAFLKA